jgi:3-oxoacyl-[acyl-carrier-protein] synthase II
MGAITAAGIGLEPGWASIVKGESAAGPITSFNAAAFPARVAAEVKNFKAEAYIDDKRIISRLGKGDDFGLAAAKMAMDDAGLTGGNADLTKGGIYVGCGKEIGTPQTLFPAVAASLDGDGRVDRRRFGEEAIRHTYPLLIVRDLPNAIVFYISRAYRLQGTNSNIIVGGTASSQAIGDAFRAIQYGDSDFVIAGGVDARVEPMNLTFLHNAGLLSTRDSEPGAACAPFDLDRDGFIVGEGAGMLILEELEHALARKARVYAELAGYAATADPYGAPRQGPGAGSLAVAITRAVQDADLMPREVSYINANGDGTPGGDLAETLAIKAAFGGAAYTIPISSIKPVIGHLMAAAGAVELIFTVMALNTGEIPPTINYKTTDPACDLDYVPGRARQAGIGAALSLNHCGISGRNTALVIKKFSHA